MPPIPSQPCICWISGPWAALIRPARSLTCWLAARLGARSAISMAPWWCTIICCANARSAALCWASGADGDADIMADPVPDIIAPGVLVVDPPAADVVVAAAELLAAVPVSVVPPQAARARVRAEVSAAAPARANLFVGR